MLTPGTRTRHYALGRPGRSVSRPAEAASPTRLLIASPDPVMDAPLSRLVDLDSVLVQRCDGVCAERCNADDQGMRSIDDAIERLGIREIVICGHASPPEAASSETPRSQWSSGLEGMLQRVRVREARNRQGREHLVRQLCELASRPVVARAIERGELVVHGLFYLAESGVFTRYDALSGQFVPLGDLDAAA